MARNDDRPPDEDPVTNVVRAISAVLIAVICFGFRNDVQNWWFRAVLGTLGILALAWGIFPLLKRKR